jgi:hypothetical protein
MIDKVWKLLESPAHWCQGVEARTIEGSVCEPGDSRAHKFCIAGAIQRIYTDPEQRKCVRRLIQSELRMKGGNEDICDWNDERGRTHAEVVSLLADIGV